MSIVGQFEDDGYCLNDDFTAMVQSGRLARLNLFVVVEDSVASGDKHFPITLLKTVLYPHMASGNALERSTSLGMNWDKRTLVGVIWQSFWQSSRWSDFLM